jgi:adenosylcobinamide-phosphate synthase
LYPSIEPEILTLLLASGLDYLIGDPWGWPHPVQIMGLLINRYKKICLRRWQPVPYNIVSWRLRWAGIILAIGLICGSSYFCWWVIELGNRLTAYGGTLIEIIILASCFAGRSLRDAAVDVMKPLERGDIVKARQNLSRYVGRDTENLGEQEILRAVLETVTENGTDGVMAPLFYGLVGIFVPVIGSASLAIGYKAISTLDSMVGYKEEPYQDIGWCSAKLEDILTWIPCRLTVITIALLSGKPGYVWRVCRRDAVKDPSPNSGWSECAYAAALGVQMGGVNWYRGVPKEKPLLGDAGELIEAKHIYRALKLTRYSFLIWLGLILIMRL